MLAAAAGVWLFAAVILPMFAPFFIGLLAAAFAERPVRALAAKRLPRRVASFLCVLAVFALAGGALFLLCRVFCREATDFLRRIPSLCQQLAPALARLQDRLYALVEKLPDGIGTGLRSGIRQLFESGGTLGATLYARLFTFASGLLSRAPGLVLFVITSVLSGFFASGELPALRAAYEKRIPAAWRAKCGAMVSHLRRTLGHWLRAQLQLMGITFLVLTAGLLLLGADYPLLAAVLIAFIDALPVFGTGTVLIPWGLLCFARGEARRGVGSSVSGSEPMAMTTLSFVSAAAVCFAHAARLTNKAAARSSAKIRFISSLLNCYLTSRLFSHSKNPRASRPGGYFFHGFCIFRACMV